MSKRFRLFIFLMIAISCSNSNKKGLPRSIPTMISSQQNHTCVLLEDHSVKCWGRNNKGQLGQGNTHDIGDDENEMGSNLLPINLGLGKTVRFIAAGGSHICTILYDDLVKCWGNNESGQLGQGDIDTRGDDENDMGDKLLPVNLGRGKIATSIAAGKNHNCALFYDKSVKCWGKNESGQLGQENTDNLGDGEDEMGDNLSLVDLGSDRTAKSIAAGFDHTCALLDNNSVKCWGDNEYGQLGQGNTDNLGDGEDEMGDNLSPVDLGSDRTAKSIAAGLNHTCVILDDNSVKCWGRNQFGKLGQGDTDDLGDEAGEMGNNLSPVDLGPDRTAKAIAAGFNHTCVILDNNLIKCWGHSFYGQLGQENKDNLGDDENEMGNDLSPVDLGSDRTAKFIAAGDNHTCALLDNNSVKCWGHNRFGQLGQENTDDLGDGEDEMGDSLPAVRI